MIHFAGYTGLATCFYDVDHKEVVTFLDAKIKLEQTDPGKSIKLPYST